MFAGLLIFILFGAGLGWIAKFALDINMSQRGALVVGALGGLVGGALGHFVLPVVTGVFGATVGGALLIWFVERWRNRVG